MKIIKIALISSIFIIVIFIIVIFVKLFIIGNLMSIERITINKVIVSESNVEVMGDFYRDSSLSFSGYKYRIDNGRMYIKIYSSFVSEMHRYSKFDINIKDDVKDIFAIYLEDFNNNKVIWQKK